MIGTEIALDMRHLPDIRARRTDNRAAVDRAVQRSRHRSRHDGKRTQHRKRLGTDQAGLETYRRNGEFGDAAAVQQDAKFGRGGK